ncbi:hypothetical protein BH10PSE12_BH10PSE12_22550 [soil metagenome]
MPDPLEIAYNVRTGRQIEGENARIVVSEKTIMMSAAVSSGDDINVASNSGRRLSPTEIWGLRRRPYPLLAALNCSRQIFGGTPNRLRKLRLKWALSLKPQA